MKWIFPVANHKLQDRLGKWNKECRWLEDWDWFVSESKEFLYHKQLDGKWQRRLLMPSSHRRYYKAYLEQDEMPSENLSRVNVRERNLNISVETYCTKQSININLDIPTTIIGSIEMSTPKIEWFMKYIQSSTNTDYLRDCIIGGTSIAVSDGSFFPLERVGACAWIVSTPDGTEWMQGGGAVPGEEY